MLQQGKKRVVCYSMCFVLMASIWSMGISFAGNSAQDKLDEVNASKNQTQAELNKGKKEAAKLTAEIKNLEGKISEAQDEIDEIKGDMNRTKKSIATAEQNLKAVQTEMTQQNDNMNERIVTMYKSGDMGMLEVILSSSDLSELMSNIDMMQRIYDSDVELLETMQVQYDKIELQKKQLAAMQEKLLQQQTNEKAKQDALEVNRGSIADKKEEVLKSNAGLEAVLDELKREADALVEEIRALQGDGVYEGGDLSWPVPGITSTSSEFGNRKHPILKVYKLHTGLDIRAPKGSTVVAAADGTVIKAGWNNSYGYMVMIDHGSGLVTLYAHNTSLNVQTGDTVKRGATIAKSGNTGMSTGPHVHFEVREDGKYVNPRLHLPK